MFKCTIKDSLFATANYRDTFSDLFQQKESLGVVLLFFLYLCFAESSTVS